MIKLHTNNSGKILTIFLVIIAILLITLTLAALFFYNIEIDKRKEAEVQLDSVAKSLVTIEQEYKDLQKQRNIFEEKNKEADERINSLLDELELQEGIREEVKLEALSLKEEIAKLKKTNEKLSDKIANQSGDLEQRIVELEAKLKVEINKNEDLREQNKRMQEARTTGSIMIPSSTKTEKTLFEPDVDLQEIIVNPDVEEEVNSKLSKSGEVPDGRILSVDIETEFVVINLGNKDGVEKGLFMSVYRGSEYLGDVKVTRVLDDMSAADLVPPFSSQMVRKNDQVIVK